MKKLLTAFVLLFSLATFSACAQLDNYQYQISAAANARALKAGSAAQDFATNNMTAAGRVVSTSPSGGVGYGAGAGGTVTQAVNINTGVTLNAMSGRISCVAANFTAGVVQSFVLTNSSIAAGDVILASSGSGYIAYTSGVGNGAVWIRIYPTTTNAGLSEIIDFIVIKGSRN